MATVTYHFPGGIYPNQYAPPLAALDYNPSFGELVNMQTSTLSSKSATQAVFQLSNGLKLKVIGTGFVFDATGNATAGTLTSIEVLQANGATKIQTISAISINLELFQNAAAGFDNWGLEEWLLNKADTVNGSAGSDDLQGRGGNDTLKGNGGDDFIVGGEGDDTYDGGADYDTLSFQDAYHTKTALRGITLNAVNGVVLDPYGNSETFVNFEEYRGTQFADTFTGSTRNETFMGLGGRDTINGGAGIDMVRYDRDVQRGGNAGVSVNLSTGVARDGFGTFDKLTSIESARGTQFADALVGNALSNFLRGEAGNDALNGAAGADEMWGGQGNDTYTVDSTGDVVDELRNTGSGVDTVRSSIAFSLASATAIVGTVENLTLLGATNINGSGNATNNILTGNTGANSLNGAAVGSSRVDLQACKLEYSIVSPK